MGNPGKNRSSNHRSIICPIMVGRDLPTQTLIRLFEQARNGHGQTVLISGEAGIGKSRLVRELRQRLHLDANLLQGSCFEADRSLPYGPIADLLRALFTTLPPADRSALLTGEMLRLLPELKDDIHDRSLPSGDGEQEKRRLHQALIQLFSRLSDKQPLLLIVEDIHWCDDASLEFLLMLTRQVNTQRMLLLLTYRDDEINETLSNLLVQLDRERNTTEFRLPRLSLEVVAEMVRAIFAMERNPRGDFVDALHTLSEGNPFFIEEVLKSLVADGDIFLADGKWEPKPLAELHIPRTVQVSLRQRLSHLTPHAREVLSVAAVTGRRFDFVLMQRLTGSSEVELLHILRELKDAQFVVEESADVFAFRHALTRQAVYQEMFARERRALHHKIASAIEHIYESNLAAKFSMADLAYHYFQAEQWEKAAHFGWEAGLYAEALYAPRAAVEQYSRALAAYEFLETVPPLLLLRVRGKAREICGDFAGAGEDYNHILELARASQNRHFEWQSLYDLGFLYMALDLSRAEHYLYEAVRVARQLKDLSALAESLNRLGNWYINQDLPVDALPYHHEALKIFAALDDLKGQAATLDLLGVTCVVAGDVVSSATYYDQAIGLFRTLDNRVGLSSALSVTCNRGGSCMAETVYCPPTGLEFLLAYADEARQIANTIGWQHGEVAVDMYVGYGLVLQGEYELGVTCAQRGIQAAAAIGHSLYKAGSEMALGRLYNDILAFEAARQILESALLTARAMSGKFMMSSVGGFLVSSYIGLGSLEQAARLIAELRTEQMQSVGQRILRCAEAELLLAQDEPDRATAIIEHLIETAPNSRGQVIPRLWYMKAEALRPRQPKHSRELLEAAIAAAQTGNLKGLLWRLCISRGRTEQTLGNGEQAEAYFDAARELLEALANSLSDRPLRQQFLTRGHALMPQTAPLSPRQVAKAAFDGLTEREREIAALIAAGKSSREIAEQLILSKRTVDAHTANILSKLGFSSRIQIARWAVEKGLL